MAVFKLGDKVLVDTNKKINDSTKNNSIKPTTENQVNSDSDSCNSKNKIETIKVGRFIIPKPKAVADDVSEESNVSQLTSSTTAKLFFYSNPGNKGFLFDREKLKSWNSSEACLKDEETGRTTFTDIYCPLVIDTEFKTDSTKITQQNRDLLTTQIKGIGKESEAVVFVNPEYSELINNAQESVGLEPFPELKSDAHFIDYLNNQGIKAKSKTCDSEVIKNLPIFNLYVYAHFATAELLLIFEDGLKKEVLNFIEDNKIQSRRRVFCTTPIKSKNSLHITDWVDFEKHCIEIDGIQYKLRLRIIDTCAIHGIAGYGDIAKNVGWELKAKDNFTKKEKGEMLRMAIERPEDFRNYALGDLDIYEILDTYDKKWREVYEVLELTEDYYQEPKLTIGGTVKDLFVAKLSQYLGIENEIGKKGEIIKSWKKIFKEDLTEKYLTFNPTELRQLFRSTKCLLSKVEGGRCRNNRPTDILVTRKIKGQYDTNLICDIDISGCYGEGQRNQLFILGIPVTFGQDISKYNEYPTLRKVLNQLGINIELLAKRDRKDWLNPENWGELVPGCWMMRMSSSEKLKYGQDVFASWVTLSGNKVDLMAKFIKENGKGNDTELVDKFESVDFDEEYGTLKIFEHEIHNGVLTHDGLQWLLGVASPRQRNELLDKCVVLSGAYYPRSQRIDVKNTNEIIKYLDDKYQQWEGKNTVDIYHNKVINVDNSCHAWIGINLGELIINDLLIERKKAQITHGKKSPLDQLFKLCVNTLYGDIVSKYFVISNPIVGNNITGRARMLAWYMEKGFNGWQTITDGCGFLLNEILKGSRDRLDGELIVSKRSEKLKNFKIKQTPLAEVDDFLMDEKGEIFIRKGDDLTSVGKGSDNAFINQKSWEHLQTQFECVDILHSVSSSIKVNKETLQPEFSPRIGQFSFETKDIYIQGGFHGSANYIFSKLNDENQIINCIKMRGYEVNKSHEGFKLAEIDEEIDVDNFVESKRYGDSNNPAKDFMNQLLESPEKIKRQSVAIKEGILKIGEYQERTGTFQKSGLVPGDGVKKAFVMAEFSLTQFTFKTYEQYLEWFKACEKLKEKHSQSLESFFLNSDGSLNFSKMVDWVYEQIQNNVLNPLEVIDPNRHKNRDGKKERKNKTKNNTKLEHPSNYECEEIKKILKGE